MYVLLLIFADKRWIIAPAAALLFILTGILRPTEAVGAINWNVLMMLTGTMATVELFIQSRMPGLMAEKLLQKVPTVQWAAVVLSVFSGVISAFVDNVATVLMVAPVGLAVARQLKTNPVPLIIAIAVSSNLQGAATLVGDTTSILLAGYMNMSFNDFFWFMGRPGIAFAVEAGALLTIPVLLFLFRHEKARVSAEVKTVVTDYIPTILMVGTVLLLIAASQFKNKPELTNGIICCGLAVIGILYEMLPTILMSSYYREEKDARKLAAISVVAAGFGGDMPEELATILIDDIDYHYNKVKCRQIELIVPKLMKMVEGEMGSMR